MTDKAEPGDFDVGWETSGVRVGLLDPILRHSELGRAAQKIKYRGELIPLERGSPVAERLLEAFQRAPSTLRSKGIVVVDPENLS